MRMHKGIVFALAVVLGVGAAAVRADDATATQPAQSTGTVSGKVVDDSGNPVKGATVQAAIPPKYREKAADKTAAAAAEKKAIVATATTGDDGTYTLKDVPAGKVRVRAGLKGTGIALTKEPVDVVAGQDTKVDDLKLEKPTIATPKPKKNAKGAA